MAPRTTAIAVPSLQHWRVNRAMLLRELAQPVGVNLRTIQRLEAGGRSSLDTVRRLAVVLQVDPDEHRRLVHPDGDAAAAPTRGAAPLELARRLTQRTGSLGTSQRPGQRAIHDDGVRHEVPDARIDPDGVDALVTASHQTHDVGGHWALIDVEIVRPPHRSMVACDGRATLPTTAVVAVAHGWGLLTGGAG